MVKSALGRLLIFLQAFSALYLFSPISHSLADEKQSAILKQYISNNHITNNTSREAFGQPFNGLSDTELEQFFRGRSLFRQSWVIAPARDSATGLGPLYNRFACISCHPKNGRGQAPDTERQRMQSMLVRFSVPGENSHGGPKPHPNYGNQLNEEGIPGVPGEGIASIGWEYFEIELEDGTRITMRKPHLQFRDLAYGKLEPVLTSARIGPPIFGLGLLEAVAVEDLQKLAQEPKPDGIKGKVNWVWDSTTGQKTVGRFGMKANVANLRAQIAEAMLGDLGITSSFHPIENCQPIQQACKKALSGETPELRDEQLADLEFYFRYLAVPTRRDINNAEVIKGEKVFQKIGCVHCHKSQLQTAKNSPYPYLSNITIQPYTDLLLHDMGEGLADGRPDFKASGSEWRTPPLWGIGHTELINEYTAYLHDGRARTLSEAILWHDGEAKKSRQKYSTLAEKDRVALERFLLSL